MGGPKNFASFGTRTKRYPRYPNKVPITQKNFSWAATLWLSCTSLCIIDYLGSEYRFTGKSKKYCGKFWNYRNFYRLKNFIFWLVFFFLKIGSVFIVKSCHRYCLSKFKMHFFFLSYGLPLFCALYSVLLYRGTSTPFFYSEFYFYIIFRRNIKYFHTSPQWYNKFLFPDWHFSEFFVFQIIIIF